MRTTNRPIKGLFLKGYANYSGYTTKAKIAAQLLRSKPVTAEKIAENLGVTRKTVVNAIGEIRRLNNNTRSKYAVLTKVRKNRVGREFLYSLDKKESLKAKNKLKTRIFAMQKDNYFSE
jgi:predicted ArsR family transcriptional regulator